MQTKQNNQAFPYILQGNNIMIVVDNKAFNISNTHITYAKVLEAIRKQDWNAVREVIEPAKMIVQFSKGHVTIKDDCLFWQGAPLHNALATRTIQMLQEGFNIEPMVAFMENLMKNPSHRSVTELYGFLEKNNLPITPDGHFLAFKRVRADYLDVHSGTMANSIGKIVEMPRNQVNDNKDETCSAGLHFCSKDYLAHFGGARIVIVKINPADVVSIPSDYNDAKGRACKYEVVGELEDVSDLGIDNTFEASVDSRWSHRPDHFVDEGDETGDETGDEDWDNINSLPIGMPQRRDSKGRFLPK